jgi:hypothetical protein
MLKDKKVLYYKVFSINVYNSMKGEGNQVCRIRCDRGTTTFQTVLSLAKHIRRLNLMLF